MLFPRLFEISYRKILKPILFLLDPEFVHDQFTHTGELLENQKWLVSTLFRYSHPSLKRQILGVNFENPIGLAAGFDYDGHMAQVMHSVGFGFNTVGSVTALPYDGNPKPRLARLPKSKSLLVNKGFKSSGALAIRKRLDAKNLSEATLGISVGSSNLPEINTIAKAINDYEYTFNKFKDRTYVKYFELNISCPNIKFKGAFYDPINFDKLCKRISNLKIRQPIFVKMPNENSLSQTDNLIDIALKYSIKGFIFSNLVKDRTNQQFDQSEIAKVSHLPGNFSGKPTFENSNKLIRHARRKYGSRIAIIGCGGVFNATDAKVKFEAGADLVQLITGMIFEGPQLIGQINKNLVS